VGESCQPHINLKGGENEQIKIQNSVWLVKPDMLGLCTTVLVGYGV